MEDENTMGTSHPPNPCSPRRYGYMVISADSIRAVFPAYTVGVLQLYFVELRQVLSVKSLSHV